MEPDLLPTERGETDVLYTQVSLFRSFMARHCMDKWTALRLFESHHIFEFLSDCHEALQLYGEAGILDEIDTLLKNCGVRLE